jgi:hypothetical protein
MSLLRSVRFIQSVSLSMNRRFSSLNLLLHMQQKVAMPGSWSQCAVQIPWRLQICRAYGAVRRQRTAYGVRTRKKRDGLELVVVTCMTTSEG